MNTKSVRVTSWLLPLSAVIAGSMALGCVPAPKKNYTPEEVGEIQTLEEIMRVQAAKMDPLFSIRDEATFTDAQYQQMIEGASVMQETTKATAEKFSSGRPEGFADYATQLGTDASKLMAAAEAKDAATAGATLSSMKEKCAGCHSDFR